LKPRIKTAQHSHLLWWQKPSVGLQSTLESLDIGVILLSSKGEVVTMNRAAARLLEATGGLRATQEGLCAERPDESDRLRLLIEKATTATTVESTSAIAVSRRDHPPLQLLISPVTGFDLDEKHPVRAIVFAGDSARSVAPNGNVLRLLFGLTPAECRLATLLADGYSPPEIAEMHGVSRNTLKSQLASIYGKTGTSRQAQLVRLLLQLPEIRPDIAS
jgi:DNA-binding CsgD family transcriptional regulator